MGCCGYEAPPGKENYCGRLSLLIGLLIFPCICLCPIDERDAGSGTRSIVSNSDF
jgi:hypothetical protein